MLSVAVSLDGYTDDTIPERLYLSNDRDFAFGCQRRTCRPASDRLSPLIFGPPALAGSVRAISGKVVRSSCFSVGTRVATGADSGIRPDGM
ncbi:hypothetical protein ACH438_44005, partial [Nocardia sp. NPDC020380]